MQQCSAAKSRPSTTIARRAAPALRAAAAIAAAATAGLTICAGGSGGWWRESPCPVLAASASSSNTCSEPAGCRQHRNPVDSQITRGRQLRHISSCNATCTAQNKREQGPTSACRPGGWGCRLSGTHSGSAASWLPLRHPSQRLRCRIPAVVYCCGAARAMLAS